MKKILIVLILGISFSGSFSQVIDTIYFDLEGEIIIKEVASIYRIAKFDTISGNIIKEFKDYTLNGDTLIGEGVVNNLDSLLIIQDYKGDSTHFLIAKKMCELKSSFIRINDYPELKNVIKPCKSVKERIDYGRFHVVEEKPDFIGGMETLGWFIGSLIKYPEEALLNNISGIVKVKFMIDIDGSIKNVSVIQGIGYGCDEEAIRVIKLLPDWLPGLQRGIPVKTYFALPITFQ